MVRPAPWCNPKRTMSSSVITVICITILSVCIEGRISWYRLILLRDWLPVRIVIWRSSYLWRRRWRRCLLGYLSKEGKGMRLSLTSIWWISKPKSGEYKSDASGSKKTSKLFPCSLTAPASPSTTDSKKSSYPYQNSPPSNTEKINPSYSSNIWSTTKINSQ